MTNSCENHAEREGLLTVSLPSFGIMRYMCGECRTAFDAEMVRLHSLIPADVKREMHDRVTPQWLRELRTGNPEETLGMEGREAGHAYMNSISKEKGCDE